jgi:hypothetical protein
MRLALATALAFLIVLPGPAQAQTRPRSEAPSVQTPPTKREQPLLTPEQAGAEADRKARARDRAWDSKMRETMGGICKGC